MVTVFIEDAERRLVYGENPGEVDGRGKENKIAIRPVYGLFQVCDLPGTVAHGRQDRSDVGVLFIGLPNAPDRKGTGISKLSRFIGFGCNHPGAVSHFPVGERRAVFHDQNPLPPDPVATAWYSVPTGSEVQTCAVVDGVRQHATVTLDEPLTVRFYSAERLTLDAILPLHLDFPAGDRCETREADVLVFMQAEPKNRPGNTFSCVSEDGYFQICTTSSELGGKSVPVEIR